MLEYKHMPGSVLENLQQKIIRTSWENHIELFLHIHIYNICI